MKVNPVLLKELKVRMRTWRVATMIGIYLLVMCIVACLMLNDIVNNTSTSIVGSSSVLVLYVGIAGIQFGLILLIVPALTAGAISGERERQTLDLLICTRLSPYSIILGKLLSSISQVILLVIASLPVFSVILFFGGISIIQILALFAYFMVVAVMAGCVGIFFSTYFKKTTVATVLTYGTGAAMLFGTILVTVFYYELSQTSNGVKHIPLIMYINPLTGFSGVMSEQIGNSGRLLSSIFSNDSGAMYWGVNVAFNIILSVVLIVLSAIKLDPTRKRSSGMGR